MFVRDIAPELAKDQDFQIAHERPGQLVFSDGIATGGDEAAVLGELDEGARDEEPWARLLPLVGRVGPARFLQRTTDRARAISGCLDRRGAVRLGGGAPVKSSM
jgi:hypothetical protein